MNATPQEVHQLAVNLGVDKPLLSQYGTWLIYGLVMSFYGRVSLAGHVGGFIGGLAVHGTTIVFSTHNVAEAEHYAGRILVLGDGELLFTGTAAELERAVGQPSAGAGERAGEPLGGDFETAFVRFLHEHGH